MSRFPLVSTALAMLLAVSGAISAAQNAGSKLVLEDGTPLKLRLSRNLSSADAKTGDQVDFEVLEELRVGDLVVVPKGGIAWGTVTDAQAKRRMGRGGRLDVNIDHVRLADGEKAALRAVKQGQGGGHGGAMAAGMVATSLVVWPAAPVFLLMHGKDVTIPKGTEITAYVNGNFEVQPAKFQPAGAAGTDAGTAANAGGASSAAVSSSPPGADIELDGNFVGSTPSTINMPAGDHVLIIRKKNFKIWERKVRATAGTIKIDAELERER